MFSAFSGDISSSQSNFIVNIIVNLFNIKNVELVSLIVRKLAHFTEYFILGLLVLNMLRFINKKIAFGIILCVIYAMSDELHQLFTPDRAGRLYDVLIDSSGSIIAILGFRKIIK